MRSLATFLFGKRTTPLRWLALAPGLVSMLFLVLSLPYVGLLGALEYLAIMLLSVAYLIRPTVMLWVPLFGWFASYSVEIASHPERSTKSDWIIFMFLGTAPAILTLLAWPLKGKPKSGSEQHIFTRITLG
jgi:hypothetical protein